MCTYVRVCLGNSNRGRAIKTVFVQAEYKPSAQRYQQGYTVRVSVWLVFGSYTSTVCGAEEV